MLTTLTLAALLAASSPAERTWVVDPAASTIRFHVDHALHKVDGEGRAIQAKALTTPDGQLRAMARMQVSEMHSGDANRDANMRAVLEADRHPFVVVRAAGPFELPASFPADTTLTLGGEVELHGVKRPITLPLRVAFDGQGTAHVTGAFTVSLDAHGIQRPSLLFKKVDDACRIEVDLVLRPEKS